MNIKSKAIWLYLKGIAMGASDVIPGVSGGTIAFITGIYPELIQTISNLDPSDLKLLLSRDVSSFWKKINGPFLLPLGLGVATSIFSLAKLILFLLAHYPIQVWSTFLGLIVFSSIYVCRKVPAWDVSSVFSFLIGSFFAWQISGMIPNESTVSLTYIFFASAAAACAMILPGISGSFILLLLGAYTQVLEALKSFEIATILVVIAGCSFGLLSFTKLVNWALKNYQSSTLALLSGFMVGSLNKLWPWKIESINVGPYIYQQTSGQNPLVGPSIFCFSVGFLVVLVLSYLSNRPTSDSVSKS